MDVIAPGVTEIVTTTIRGGYGFGSGYTVLDTNYSTFNGTSAAAPHVAGVAALMMSRHRPGMGAPNLLAIDDVENILQSTATDINDTVVYPTTPEYDKYSGWGRINATASLQAVASPQRYVRHSGTPISTTVSQPELNVAVTFVEYDTLFQPGDYLCDRYTITQTFSTTLPPNSGIFNIWPRFSSSRGASPDDTNGNNCHDKYCEITATVNQNIISVTAKTYVYYIKQAIGGTSTISNQFWPCTPSQAKTAYSVHVSSTPIVSSVATEHFEDGGFIIFPNPTTGVINLHYTGKDLLDPTITVTDIAGRVTYVASLSGRRATIDVSIPAGSLNSGIYTCRILSKNGLAMTQKFSKY